MLRITSSCILLFVATSSATFAQVGRPERKAPTLTEEYQFSLDYSASSDLERNGTALGEVSVTAFSGGARTFRPLNSEGLGLILGLEWSEYQLDVDPITPLPDQLRQIQFVVGLNYPLNQQWTAGIFARPGIYSDFDSIGSRDLNMPTLFALTYVRSRDLIWLFGVNVNPFSEYPAIPAVGVRWNFAPEWTFSLGFPRTGFAYQATDRLTWHAGASFSGGSFHVGERQGPGLRNTLLDYREIRVGVSAEYDVTKTLAIELEVGSSVDRQFDYFDQDFEIKGDATTYVKFSLSGKF